MEVAVASGRPISELARVFERVPQHLANVPVAKKPPLETLESVTASIAKIEKELDGKGRVLVRYSGTENKARVMVEGPDMEKTKRYAQDIAAALKKAIGR